MLDPACGSGNFLFIAYREMKRLERDIPSAPARSEPARAARERDLAAPVLRDRHHPVRGRAGESHAHARERIELIKAQKLAETDQLLIEEKPLPLDNLDKNNHLRRRALHRMA
ncbi:MAG: DNA methyltransferase [Chthoniobacterales bacterium]